MDMNDVGECICFVPDAGTNPYCMACYFEELAQLADEFFASEESK